MAMIEKWEIALGGGAKNFKEALHEGQEKIATASSGLQAALIGVQAQETTASLDTVKKAGAEVQEAVLNVETCIWDLRIALQNSLLGGLFEYRISVRTPGDPKYAAVTLDAAPPADQPK